MTPFQFLALIVGWIIAVGLGLLWLLILYRIFRGDINLNYLISEKSGQASMSRFQFMIFTFVIAMGFFIITISSPTPTFPSVPGDVLALMGISGGTYIISKGIQANMEDKAASKVDKVEVKVAPAMTPAAGNGHETAPAGPKAGPVG